MTANAWVMASAVWVSIFASMFAAAQSVYADNAMVNAPVRICASYLSQVGADSLDVRTMEREVNQIWAPHGVRIEGLVEPCKTPGEGPTLKVRLRKTENVRAAGIPRGTLGNIYFVAGKPTPLIDLWADRSDARDGRQRSGSTRASPIRACVWRWDGCSDARSRMNSDTTCSSRASTPRKA